MLYTNPLLSDKQICQILGELKIKCVPDNIAKPTPEFVQSVYETLIELVSGVTREDLQQPVFSAIDELEFPELHDGSIPVMAFMAQLGKLLQASGINDLSLKDIHKPDPTRLRRNLSAVLNFAMFREDQLTVYTQLQEQHEGYLRSREEAQEEHDRLQADLRALDESEKAEEPEARRLTDETAAIFSENQSLNRQQAALAAEVKTLKSEAAALADAAAQSRQHLSAAQSEEESLRSQIVHSPQRLEAALHTLSLAVERERDACAEAERRLREAGLRAEAASRAEKELSKAGEALAGLGEAIDAKRAVSREVKALRSQVGGLEAEAARQTAAAQLAARAAASLEERATRARAAAAARREAAESNVARHLRDREEAEAERAAAAARLAQDEAAARKVQERLRGAHAAHAARVRAVGERYRALVDQVTHYHAELDGAMSQGAGRGA